MSSNNLALSTERISGYVSRADYLWWTEEFRRVAHLEGLRTGTMGILWSRIARFNIKLDLESLTKHAQETAPAKVAKPPGKSRVSRAK